jgi:hypothetical protein
MAAFYELTACEAARWVQAMLDATLMPPEGV